MLIEKYLDDVIYFNNKVYSSALSTLAVMFTEIMTDNLGVFPAYTMNDKLMNISLVVTINKKTKMIQIRIKNNNRIRITSFPDPNYEETVPLSAEEKLIELIRRLE